MEQMVLTVSLIGVGLFLMGMASGLVIGHFVLPGQRRARRLELRLEEITREFSEYKASVTDHFHKTADLVGEMTRSYKAVYDHLAGGARSLCVTPPAGRTLRFVESRLVEEGDGVEGVAREQAPEPATHGEQPQAA